MSERRASMVEYRNEDGEYVYEPPLPELMPALPFQVRVRRRRWVWSLLFGLLGTVFVPWLLVVSAGGGGSAMLWVFRIGAVLVWPVAVLVLVHACQAVFRPRHITFDEERVWTRDWSLDWVDVQDVYLIPDSWRHAGLEGFPDHKQRVSFLIDQGTHDAKVMDGNRWDSGYPFGLGGLAPHNRIVNTQYDTEPRIRDVYLVMKVLQKRAREAVGLPSLETRLVEP